MPVKTNWRRSVRAGFAASIEALALSLLVAAKTANAAATDDLSVQLERAAALHERADFAHSIPLLKQIVRLSPRNYDANLLLGEDLDRSGNVQDAIGPLEMACKVRPKDGAAEVYLADAAATLGDYPTAAKALQAGIARSGGSAPFLESWASFCLQRFKILQQSLRTNKRGEATALRVEAALHPEGSETREKVLEQSAADDPDQRGIWGELGTAQLERGMRTQAQESLKEAERRGPQQAETLQLEALLAAAEENWPVAEERFAALGAQSPAELHSAVGVWQHIFAPRLSTSGATWDCLRTAKAACPEASGLSAGNKGSKASELYEAGRWEQLLAIQLPAVSDRDEMLWRGVALAKTGQCPQAIPFLESGLKADESTTKFWLDICYAAEGQRVVARLGQEGSTTATHRLRGDTLLILNSDPAGAAKEYAEALKSEPRNLHLLERSAKANMALGNDEQTENAAREALEVDPHSLSAIETLAWLAIKNRDYAEALVRLKQMLAINPKDEWTQVELGVAYGQLDHPEEALRYLVPRLTAGYPDDKGALHAMLASDLRKLGREDEAHKAAAEAARLANSSLDGGVQGSGDAHP